MLPAEIDALTERIIAADAAEARRSSPCAPRTTTSAPALPSARPSAENVPASATSNLSRRRRALDETREAWRIADAAYRKETSESSLAAALEEEEAVGLELLHRQPPLITVVH